MKTLYIVRHAKATQEDALADFERPLNARGRLDAPEIGRRLYIAEVKPHLIISSAAFRTLSTARLIARELDYPDELIKADFRIYQASAYTLLNLLAEQDDSNESILMVGHNPAMHELTARLGGNHLADFPTCTVAAISFATDSWQKLKNGAGKLLFIESPKK